MSLQPFSPEAAHGYWSARHRGAYQGDVLRLVWAVGPDSVSYLQGVLSQDVESLIPGQVARSFLLDPRGRVHSVLWLLRAADRVGIVGDANGIEETVAMLSRWMVRVDVELRGDERPAMDLWGEEYLGLAGPKGWSEADGLLVAELRPAPIRRRLVVGLGRSELETRGAIRLAPEVFDTFRVESGEPRMGFDIDQRTIPNQTGLVEEAVSFTKGCFLGQELVTRIDSRGNVNRQLRGLRLLSAPVPPVGSTVEKDGKQLGVISTVGRSPALGSPVALAILHRDAVPGTRADVVWEVGQLEAEVVDLPMTASDSHNSKSASPV